MSFVAQVLVVAAVVSGLISGAASAAPPEIRISPELPSGWMTHTSIEVQATATSEAGVARIIAYVSHDRSVKASLFQCFGSCPAAASVTHLVRPRVLADGEHEFLVAATGENSEQSILRTPFRVDRTAPDAASDPALVGGDEWRARNVFDVSWVNPPQDGVAPIAAAEFELCPVDVLPESPRSCVSGRREAIGIQRIDDIAVPGSGTWRLRLVLVDEAGNLNREHAVVIDGLRLDAEPPSLAFAHDPPDSAKVRLSASDYGSGLNGVTIEARRQGEHAWRSLTVERGDQFTAVLDDDLLPEGTYQLRAHASDALGNERTLTTWPDGRPAEVRLPYRPGSRLSAGLRVRGPSGGVRLERRPLLDYGRSAVLRGRIVDDSGSGRGAATIAVSERLASTGADWQRVATTLTDGSGAFTYKAPRGPARTIRFEYASTATARSASTEVELRVRGGTTLGADRRRLRNGESIVLRGRLKGREVPSAGKLVALQARSARGWLTFGTARARASDGRWSYRYTFTGTTTTARYQFRVVVPREAAYPYVSGASKRFSVVVRGSG